MWNAFSLVLGKWREGEEPERYFSISCENKTKVLKFGLGASQLHGTSYTFLLVENLQPLGDRRIVQVLRQWVEQTELHIQNTKTSRSLCIEHDDVSLLFSVSCLFTIQNNYHPCLQFSVVVFEKLTFLEFAPKTSL